MPATDAQIHTCGKNTAGRAPEGGSRSASTSRPAWAVYAIATGGQDPTAVVATPVGRMPKLRPISIPTEPIGSIPRPLDLLERVTKSDSEDPNLAPFYDAAIRDTIERFEATGSPVVTDGEQSKYHNFCTYCVHGLANTAPDGFKIPFSDGHTRRLVRLTSGPFRYKRYADSYLDVALRYAHVPVKQAVISPSALSLIYPAERIRDYSREQFIDDLLSESETEIRRCLNKGAHKVQLDFTEGRLAVKIDPSGHLLNSFIDLNNLLLSRFAPEQRRRIGVHTCPGNDLNATHSADVDYAELLPSLFELKAGNFYVALAGEPDRHRALEIIRKFLKPHHRIFIGVTAPVDPHIETPEEVRDRVLEASEYIPIEQLGTTDDCGFSPFSDDTSTSRDTAFAKIQARVLGTKLAETVLGGYR
jgi:5-methyltetrahydropteroyltriglutamate--homocysteine methyltransferase